MQTGMSTTPSIPLTLEDDGVSQMTLSFLDLEQIGSYIAVCHTARCSRAMLQQMRHLIIDSFWIYHCRVSVLLLLAE